MRLVIFPGAGSPLNLKYSSVYDLLTRLALRNGYDGVDGPLVWPGQAAGDGEVLSLPSAVNVAATFCAKLESSTQSYDILGRSFGCVVALKLAVEKELKNLRKLILWGPPQFWLQWEMCELDSARTVRSCAEKGTSIDGTFFPSFVPVEYLISRIAHDVILATGERDRFCSHDYLAHLSAIRTAYRNPDLPGTIEVTNPVQGAEHEITEAASEKTIRDYENALFRS